MATGFDNQNFRNPFIDSRNNILTAAPYKPIKGDFTPFYVIIAICTIVGLFVIILNIVLGCSRYRHYWCDSNTGNRWVLPLWIKTPTNQTPLDLTELDEAWLPPPPGEYPDYPDNYSDYYEQSSLGHHQISPHEEFIELVKSHKKESDI